MTEVGTLHREDTGALATIRTVDPLGVGNVEIDEKLPLAFAGAIEQWLRDEHGYDYADVVARSAGARAESRKKLEMLNVLDPIDFDPKSKIRLEIQVDTSAFDAEMQRAQQIISEMPELPDNPPGVARVKKPDWTPPPQMIEKYASAKPRGDGIPVLAEAHDRSLRSSASVAHEPTPSIEDFGPAPDENMPGRACDDVVREMSDDPQIHAALDRADDTEPQKRRMSWSEEWAAFHAEAQEIWRDATAWLPWRRSKS